MRKFKREPSQEHLRTVLGYDPDTGVFTWKSGTRAFRNIAGEVAGSARESGYVTIGFRGVGQIMAHRVAWVYMYGPIPEGMEIDHKDRNPNNNAISNLRLATRSDQNRNKRVQSNNRSGLKGAYFHACRKGKKWRSQLKMPDGKLKFIGYFDTAEEAHKAYADLSNQVIGEFNYVGG